MLTSLSGTYSTLSTPLTSVNVHMYGGNIIPIQESALTTTQSRLTPFSILIALDSTGYAAGTLFRDDGEQLALNNYLTAEYNCKVGQATGGTGDPNSFTASVTHDTYSTSTSDDVDVGYEVITSIVIMGTAETLLAGPVSISLNGNTLHSSQYSFNSFAHVLTVSNIEVKLNTDISMTWV